MSRRGQDIKLRVEVRHDGEDGLWYAKCIDLQGCHTFGASKEEALENIYEAIDDRIHAILDMAKKDLARKRKQRSSRWSTQGGTETVDLAVV